MIDSKQVTYLEDMLIKTGESEEYIIELKLNFIGSKKIDNKKPIKLIDYYDHLINIIKIKYHDAYRCIHLSSALCQRANELKQGVGLLGTKGYADQGCYDCKGYNSKCPKYISCLELGKDK